ncbi:dermonecrotic toxin domain-containing protein [Pseudomonas sp. 18175]|uniref:dermonecrotic toxin domain-containing protein n=1 Tax=Pseudomonas sp. 18175 TaxID=3390056 RepID=UPI003D248F29
MLPTNVLGSYFDATARRIDANSPEEQPQVRTPDPATTRAKGTEKPLTLRPPTVTPELSDYIKTITSGFLSPSQTASNIVSTAIKNTWKIDIDPDKARIATFNYEIGQPKPAPGKLLNSITLTDAALKNMRDKNPEDESVGAERPWWLKMLDVAKKGSPLAAAIEHTRDILHYAHTHEYIIPGFSPDPQHVYQTHEKLHHSPQAFRDLMRQTELSEPYKAYLDKFWPANEENYTQSSKFAFAAAAQIQLKEGSLSNYETTLVMRAAGFGANSRLSDMAPSGLKAGYRKDPNIETGLLSINGSPSTSLVYVTDKQSRLNAKGKKVHHTLLYIPGNSSPIHRFESVAQMKSWLADQAADPNKRAQLSTHFEENDQDDKVFSSGVKQALAGLGGWTEAHRPNKLGFESPNEWDPQTYITTVPVDDDPFHTMTQRQKARSYADAAHDIVTDGDVLKRRAVNLAEAATVAALMLTPLAMVIPEVAVAVEAAYVAAGAVEAGAGIDDAVHGKSTAKDRIVFGLLNAAPALMHLPSRLPGLSAMAHTTETAASASRPHVEFEEVFDSEQPRQTRQIVELAADDEQPSATKRVHLDNAEDTGAVKRSKPADDARDLNKINDLVFTFVDTYNGVERLNIVAEGGLQHSGADAVADMMLDDVRYDATELLDLLWDNDVAPEEYANVRLLMCNAGKGAERSFAAQFQELVNVPVKAYASRVTAQFTLDDIQAVFEPKARTQKVVKFDGVLPAERRHRVIKQNPYSSDVNGPDYSNHARFTYDPVHFPPRSENPKPVLAGSSMPEL